MSSQCVLEWSRQIIIMGGKLGGYIEGMLSGVESGIHTSTIAYVCVSSLLNVFGTNMYFTGT